MPVGVCIQQTAFRACADNLMKQIMHHTSVVRTHTPTGSYDILSIQIMSSVHAQRKDHLN